MSFANDPNSGKPFTICVKGDVHIDGKPCEKCKAEAPEVHPDITANKHKGNRFSAKANPSESVKSRDLRIIYDAFVKVGPQGSIAEKVYLPLGYLPQTGSARCSDLKRLGKLVGTGRKDYTGTGSAAEILVADIYIEKLVGLRKSPESTKAHSPDVMPDVEEL